MNPANQNRANRWSLCVFSAGTAIGLLLMGGVCGRAFGQVAQAAQPAAKAAAQPATKTPAKPDATKPAVPATQPVKPAVAPTTPAPPTKSSAGKDGKEKKKEEPPPAPESSYLRTKDGWNIFYTYYGPKKGVRSGKHVVPIIMLHGWKGQGSEYADLATVLQSGGFASIVPDLRGHGRSVSRKKPDGEDEVVQVDDLKPQDIDGMILDVEAVKKALIDKNNNAELNIEMLAVIGAEVGSIVAVNWAALDWTWPPAGNVKQGQDVKALVLLSPQQTFKSLTCSKALATPVVSQRLSVLIAAGNQQLRDFSEAKRIHTRLERQRPTIAPEERLQKLDLFLIEASTPLQGTKLLDRALPVGGYIMRFFDLRLLRKLESFQWTDRTSPLAGK